MVRNHITTLLHRNDPITLQRDWIVLIIKGFLIFHQLPRAFSSLCITVCGRRTRCPVSGGKQFLYKSLNPDKDPFLTTSYRPISLTNCVWKNFVAYDQPSTCLDTGGPRSSAQCDFRHRLEVIDHLMLHLEQDIRSAFIMKQHFASVIFHLVKARDTIMVLRNSPKSVPTEVKG